MRVLPLLLLLPLASSGGSAAETAIRPDRTIQLFDGKSLAPFYTWLVDSHREDPLRVFTVVDQVDGAPAIRISGERWGGLVTRETYRDYRLVVEFRWGLADVGRAEERRPRQRHPGPRPGRRRQHRRATATARGCARSRRRSSRAAWATSSSSPASTPRAASSRPA